MTTPNHRIRLVMELRASGVSDTAVLAAIERVPREMFVPTAFRDRAYENAALPIGHGQTLSQPSVVGLMTQALELGARMKVLEIGTGSGYQAAILGEIAREVYTIERHKELLIEAEQRFRALKLHNVTTRVGDGWLGWPEQAPFDRIIVTAAPPELPRELLDQLRDGGFLVAPIGAEKRLQTLVRVRRGAHGFAREEIAAVRFVPMVEGMPPDSGSDR